jgi:hypothetical protein
MKRAVAVLVVLALTLAPIAAFGATSTPVPAATSTGAVSARTTPGPFATPTEMQVQLWPSEADGAQLIISLDLPAGTPLPATVRIPLPEGATPGWVGEISTAGLNSDIKRDYTVEQGTGGRVVVFRIEKHRSVQVEASYTAPQVIGDKTISAFEWVQSAPSPLTNFAVKMGANTKDVAVDPTPTGAPQSNAQGERLYTVASSELKPGARFAMTVAYRVGVAGDTTAASGRGSADSQTVLIVLVAMLAVAVFAFMLVAARARGRERVADEAPAQRRVARQAEPEEPVEDDPFDVDLE